MYVCDCEHSGLFAWYVAPGAAAGVGVGSSAVAAVAAACCW